MWQIPLDESGKFPVPYPTDILRMPGFSTWIIGQAEKNENVRFFFGKSFESPVITNRKLSGVNISGIGEVNAKIIIDCSGRTAVVRNSLPEGCGLPALKTRPQRMFTVYMEDWDCPNGFPQGSNTFVCFKGFANQVAPTRTLVGASSLLGLEAAKLLFGECVQHHLKDIQHEVVSVFHSQVPYDFPPASLVTDNFVTIGDSAFQNKPFSGEGMASGMEAAMIAVPVIIKAIKSGNTSKEQLWEYNVSYFWSIGADFGLIRGAGETLVELTPQEFNWMYEAEFISASDMMDTWMDYRVNKGIIDMISTFFKGIKNISVFKRVLKGLFLGVKLRNLYLKYPDSPEKLPWWERKFHLLLEK